MVQVLTIGSSYWFFHENIPYCESLSRNFSNWTFLPDSRILSIHAAVVGFRSKIGNMLYCIVYSQERIQRNIVFTAVCGLLIWLVEINRNTLSANGFLSWLKTKMTLLADGLPGPRSIFVILRLSCWIIERFQIDFCGISTSTINSVVCSTNHYFSLNQIYILIERFTYWRIISNNYCCVWQSESPNRSTNQLPNRIYRIMHFAGIVEGLVKRSSTQG